MIGFLVLLRGEGRGFTVRDVAAAEEVARRAALSLDSARLYRARVELTSALQAALRPPALPTAPGLRLAATYRAAAEHLDIGGDFYDAFGTAETCRWSAVRCAGRASAPRRPPCRSGRACAPRPGSPADRTRCSAPPRTRCTPRCPTSR